MSKMETYKMAMDRAGIPRRDFLRFCSYAAMLAGIEATGLSRVVHAFENQPRPPVIWLHFGECTGCSEAVLRSQYPYADDLVLEILSLEYHELKRKQFIKR